MILLGSRSLALRAPMALNRRPLDFDWVCTKEEFDRWMEQNSAKINPTKVYELPEYHKWICEGSTNCEFEIIQPGSSNELLVELVEKDPATLSTQFGLIPSTDTLFAIKSFHRFKKFSNPKNFWKTCVDWHAMKRLGATIKEEHMEFYRLRERESYAAQQYPKLNVSKENFFKDDGIHYDIDHDSLHEAMKHLEMPAYKYYAKDNEPVFSDKAKFLACSPEVRMYGAIEEVSVLAIERSVHPHPGAWPHDYAWKYALAKLGSTISSGWFRSWVYENIPSILKAYPADYVEQFERGIKNGTVRYIQEAKQD